VQKARVGLFNNQQSWSVPMAALRITGSSIAPSHKLLQQEIDEALEEVPEIVLQYFLSMVKERGRALQRKFRAYQHRHGRDATFGDFVSAIIKRKPLSQAFTPDGCKFPRHPAAERTLAKMRGLPEDELLVAGLSEIRFGRGPAYMDVRRHRCSHCPARNCMHNHPPPIKP
jgi:hypothetical protein